MEHCTGASKEIKFNITYRDKLLYNPQNQKFKF